eukprot:18014-Heterococcus_DN1.PRE.2
MCPTSAGIAWSGKTYEYLQQMDYSDGCHDAPQSHTRIHREAQFQMQHHFRSRFRSTMRAAAQMLRATYRRKGFELLGKETLPNTMRSAHNATTYLFRTNCTCNEQGRSASPSHPFRWC